MPFVFNSFVIFSITIVMMNLIIFRSFQLSMAVPTANVLADFTKCNICNEEYQNPKLLDCLHTFCGDCILKTNAGASTQVLCPKCQLPTDFIDVTKKDLTPNNFLSILISLVSLQNLAKSSPHLVQCHECILGKGNQVAVCVCIVCLQPMCSVDKNAHTKHFMDHSYITIPELAEQNVLKIASTLSETPHCTQHPNQIGNAFCTDCNVFICTQSCVVAHQKCNISREFQGILAEKRDDVNKLMLKAHETSAMLKTTIQQYGKRKRDAENTLQILEATIDKEFALIFKVLEERKQEILCKARGIYQPNIDCIVGESTLLYRKMKALTDATQFCHLVIDANHSSSLPQVHKHYTKLFASSDTIARLSLPEYKFTIDRTIRTTINCLGKLTHVKDMSPSIGIKVLPEVDKHLEAVAIAFDGSGKLYLFDKHSEKVKVMTDKLEDVCEFGVEHESGPVSLCANKGFLFVCLHEENIVKVFTPEGTLLRDLEGGKDGEKDLFDFSDSFTGLTCTDEGHLLVADSGNNRVHVYSPDLKFSHFIGELFAAGALRRPVDVSANPQTHIAVLHWANPCINLYSLKGVILSQFGSLLSSLELSLPVKLTYLANGKLMVLDYKSQNLSVYSEDRHILTCLETILPPIPDDNNLIPSMAIGNNGDLFFCEPNTGQVILYKNDTIS